MSAIIRQQFSLINNRDLYCGLVTVTHYVPDNLGIIRVKMYKGRRDRELSVCLHHSQHPFEKYTMYRVKNNIDLFTHKFTWHNYPKGISVTEYNNKNAYVSTNFFGI